MSNAPTYTLLATALVTSVLHALIPDHWLPFVLMGRARNWSLSRAASISGLSAAVHGLLSITLGAVAVLVGIGWARSAGETLERASGVMLVLFGLAYAAWAWRKRGHFHPGGALVHRGHDAEGCDGAEGPANPEHLHYHADTDLIRGRSGPGALVLALVVGLNPCVVILPVLLMTARQGTAAVALVAAAYAVTALALTVALTVAGVAGSRRVRLPWAARHMELASGLVIAGAGLVFVMLEG